MCSSIARRGSSALLGLVLLCALLGFLGVRVALAQGTTCPSKLPCLTDPKALSAPLGPHAACPELMSYVERSRIASCGPEDPDMVLVRALARGFVASRRGLADPTGFQYLRQLSSTHGPSARWLCFAAVAVGYNYWKGTSKMTDCDSYLRFDPALGGFGKGVLALLSVRRTAAVRSFGTLRSAGIGLGDYGYGRLREGVPGTRVEDLLPYYHAGAMAGDPLSAVRYAALAPFTDAVSVLQPFADQGYAVAQILLSLRLSAHVVGPRAPLPDRWRNLWPQLQKLPEISPESPYWPVLVRARAWADRAVSAATGPGLEANMWASRIAVDMIHRQRYHYGPLLSDRARELRRSGEVSPERDPLTGFTWLWTPFEASCIDARKPCLDVDRGS